ncbi:MAG: 1,4-alpha-glucan branching protein domain-containing protein [bacterium]
MSPESKGAPGALSLVLRHHVSPVGDPASAARFEAYVAETLLPLIAVGGRLRAAGVRGALTAVISPLLAEACADPTLTAGVAAGLGARLRAAEAAEAAAVDRAGRLAAARRRDRAAEAVALFEQFDRDLNGAWRALAEAGVVELATTPATDAVLPLIGERAFARPQIAVAVATHARHFGAAPAGIDLTRGYAPRLDLLCAEYGLSWCLVGPAAFAHASAPVVYGRFAPLHCPTSGVAAFAVEPAASLFAHSGDDPRGGFLDRGVVDAPASLHLALHPDALGFAGRGERAMAASPFGAPRDLDAAEAAAGALAGEWLGAQRAALAGAGLDRAPHRVAFFDAALFGRWWAEGPAFVEAAARLGGDVLATPSAVLARHPVNQSAWPGLARLGGDGGFADAARPDRAWLLGALPRAARQMTTLADRYTGTVPRMRGVAVQAAQALLLAQCGDWPVMIEDGVAADAAVTALRGHLETFAALRADLLDAEGPQSAAEAGGPFAELDLEVFASW